MSESHKYTINLGSNKLKTDHQYLRYEVQSYEKSEIRKLTAYILNHYTKQNISVSKYRKLKPFEFNWTDEKRGQIKGSLSFNDIFEHIIGSGTFDNSIFNLPRLESPILDSSIDVGLPQPLLSRDGKRETAKLNLPLTLGDNFPISPKLDREGFATSNLQKYVTQNIVNLHKLLVQKSHLACSIRNEWFNNFRMMINECVSAIDMQLHKIYLLAEYRGHELGLSFDQEALGVRHGRRVTDKFNWIVKITGKPLDDARDEVAGFCKIKDLRNHLNHFDPPCFCCTLEDVRNWLNIIPDIGRLLWKIREKFNAQLSAPIVELIMIPKVEFVPLNIADDRPISNEGIGYNTSIWQNA